jgi:hypothetical protein
MLAQLAFAATPCKQLLWNRYVLGCVSVLMFPCCQVLPELGVGAREARVKSLQQQPATSNAHFAPIEQAAEPRMPQPGLRRVPITSACQATNTAMRLPRPCNYHRREHRIQY